MKRYIWRVGGVLVVLAVIVALIPVFLPPGSDMESDDLSDAAAARTPRLITLARPAFAAGGQMGGMNFLEEEAGISAFTDVGREIDLDRAKGAFRTIERETDEYIIGSVGVPELGEDHDVHVFLHRDGWVVAYYGRERPTAWIIDWRDLETTKLEAALMQVTAAAGVSIRDVSYYNFRDPEAEKLMIIIDHDSFNLKIPGDFTVFERSYSFRDEHREHSLHRAADHSSLSISGDTIQSLSRWHGIIIATLTSAQLRPDVFHTVSTAGLATSVAIVIVYREG